MKLLDSKVHRRAVTHKVVDALLGMLRSGSYRIGDRLPSEWDLVRNLTAKPKLADRSLEQWSLTLLRLLPESLRRFRPNSSHRAARGTTILYESSSLLLDMTSPRRFIDDASLSHELNGCSSTATRLVPQVVFRR